MTDDKAPVDERLNAAICSEAVTDGCVVTGWVLACTLMDSEGADRVAVYRMPNLTLTGELGLLDYAHTSARAVVHRKVLGPPE